MNCKIVSNGKAIAVHPLAYEVARDLQTLSGAEVARKYGLTFGAVYGFKRVVGYQRSLTFKERYDIAVDYLQRVDFTSKSALRTVVPQRIFDDVLLFVQENRPDLFAKIKNGRRQSRKTLKKRVVRIMNENPDLSAAEIAALSGCSRQYVYMLQEKGRAKNSRSSPRTH